MHYLKLSVISCITAVLLVACGGGGGTGSGTSTTSTLTLTPPPSFANTVTSELAFPFQSALRDSTQEGSTANYSISGDCGGTASTTSSTPTSATFEGLPASVVANSATLQVTGNNCPLYSSSSYSTDYFNSDYLPLGAISSSGEYGLFLTAPVVPVSVNVGDSGTIGTKNYYADSSKQVAIGYDTLSYVIEPDTANTAIVNMINKSFDQHGVLYFAEQNRYRIWSNGALVSVSSDIQMAGLHLVLTAVPDATPPTVIYSVPGTYGNTSIPCNINITAIFSERIDSVTLDATSVTLRSAGGGVSGIISYSGKTVTFVPSSYLLPSTSYTLTISSAVKDLAGNAMASSYSWSFVTESPYSFPPSVSYTTPAKLAHFVPVSSVPTANFGSYQRINPATITNATFHLMEGSVPVDGTVAFVAGYDDSAIFTPAAPLKPDTVYTATITNGVQDIQGQYLTSDYSWSFVTDSPLLNDPASVFPAAGTAYGVAIGDVTGDGRNDLVYGGGYAGCDLEVFPQNANGGLDAPASYSLAGGTCWPTGLAIGDVNHDGRNDVVVGNGNGGLLVYTQSSNGTLNGAVVYASSDTKRVRIADVNNDGLMDVIGAGGGISVWLQNANGTLNAPVQISLNGSSATDMDVGDVNNDGLNDIVVSFISSIGSANVSMFVIAQQQGGTLNTPVSYDLGQIGLSKGLVVGDIDSDGLNEIVYAYAMTANGSGISVLHQNGAGAFDPPVSYASVGDPTSLGLADMSGDGRMDVVAITSFTDFKIVGYKQLSDGSLQSVRQYSSTNTQINPSFGPFAVGDINGDGKVDVVVPDIFSVNLPVYYHK